MILFNNILQTCNSYVGNGAHTVPPAHYKYNRIITCRNIRLAGEALGYTFYFLIESEFQRCSGVFKHEGTEPDVPFV